jgi:hypothetical protein
MVRNFLTGKKIKMKKQKKIKLETMSTINAEKPSRKVFCYAAKEKKLILKKEGKC